MEHDALEVVRLLDDTSIDLIVISGGTYFPGAEVIKTKTTGPYFAEFAKAAKQRTLKPLMLTGGIKHRDQAVKILEAGIADAIGLARALVIDPDLPNKWFGEQTFTMDAQTALRLYNERDSDRCKRWLARFGSKKHKRF